MWVHLTLEQVERLKEIASSDPAIVGELQVALDVDADPRTETLRNYAGDEDHPSDVDAPVSYGEDDGAYVGVWEWVPFKDVGIEVEEDDGCPKGDPDCLGRNGDCHDACESPETTL